MGVLGIEDRLHRVIRGALTSEWLVAYLRRVVNSHILLETILVWVDVRHYRSVVLSFKKGTVCCGCGVCGVDRRLCVKVARLL